VYNAEVIDSISRWTIYRRDAAARRLNRRSSAENASSRLPEARGEPRVAERGVGRSRREFHHSRAPYTRAKSEVAPRRRSRGHRRSHAMSRRSRSTAALEVRRGIVTAPRLRTARHRRESRGERFYDEGEDLWPKRLCDLGRLVAQQPRQDCVFDHRCEVIGVHAVRVPADPRSEHRRGWRRRSICPSQGPGQLWRLSIAPCSRAASITICWTIAGPRTISRRANRIGRQTLDSRRFLDIRCGLGLRYVPQRPGE